MAIDDFNPNSGHAPDRDEDITRLYVARIDGGECEPRIVQFITLDGPQDFHVYGEIVLEAGPKRDYAPVVTVRRLALYGSIADKPPAGEDRYGVISIVGSSLPLTFDDRMAGIQSFDFPATLHYRALSERPAYRTENPEKDFEDAEFPSVEVLQVKVALSRADYSEGAIHLSAEIRAELADDTDLGLIQSFTFEPFRGVFLQGGTGEPRGKPTYSLSSHCASPETPVDEPCPATTLSRYLPVKFVNFTDRSIGDLEPLCQGLLDRVCEVWRNQAALDLTVEGVIQDATDDDKARYGVLPSETLEHELETCVYTSTTHIEIYICAELDANYNGGIAYACGQASAYCLLSLDRLGFGDLEYLLAHELGHVLGLFHPGRHPKLDGSVNSIMAGAGMHNPHQDKNTLYNCRIFSMQPENVVVGGVAKTVVYLNPIVHTTTIADCFRPLG